MSKKMYGMTMEEFEKLKKQQGSKCAICGESDEPLVIDHDHYTGTVRALLCNSCNVAIGLFREDVSVMKKAMDYLVSHNASSYAWDCARLVYVAKRMLASGDKRITKELREFLEGAVKEFEL